MATAEPSPSPKTGLAAIYSPSLPQGCIRLLKINANHPRGPIHCSLVQMFLGDMPYEESCAYRALSYVWGADPSRTESIVVNGYYMAVTVSLASALREHRDRGYTGYLWADAICINQHDVSERSEQVRLMFKIYQSAREVIIWLGDASETSHRAMTILLNFDRLSDSQRQDLCGEEALHALLSLLQRPWWFRAWVAQEMIAARNLEIWCGTDVVEYDHLYHFVSWAFLQEDVRIALTAANGGLFQGYMLGKDREIYLGIGHMPRQLVATLHLHRRRVAGDPRDKVYSVLGLAFDVQNIIPDYSMSFAETYTATAINIVERTRRLDLLSFTDVESNRGEMPTWVPNWRFSMDSEPILPLTWTDRQLYHASGNKSSHNLTVRTEKSRVLCVNGFECAKICKVCAEFRPLAAFLDGDFVTYEKDLHTTVLQWHHDLRPSIGHFGNYSAASTAAEAFEEAFWRTVTTDVVYDPKDGDYRRADIADMEDYIRWLRGSEKGALETAANNLVKLQYRRIGQSDNFLLALLPGDTKLGDLICVFSGADVPFIVRRLPHSDFYQLIGECYVHGLMDGEVMTALGKGEVKEKTFTLI